MPRGQGGRPSSREQMESRSLGPEGAVQGQGPGRAQKGLGGSSRHGRGTWGWAWVGLGMGLGMGMGMAWAWAGGVCSLRSLPGVTQPAQPESQNILDPSFSCLTSKQLVFSQHESVSFPAGSLTPLPASLLSPVIASRLLPTAAGMVS